MSTQISPFIQAQREVIVKTTEPTTIESLQAKNPRALQSHADRAIEQIQVPSDNQLKSGDLSQKTTKLETLSQFATDRVKTVGRAASVRVPTYCKLALGI